MKTCDLRTDQIVNPSVEFLPGPDLRHLPKWKQAYIWLTTVPQYKLTEDFILIMPDGEEYFFPIGFIFDGASVPKMFWPLLNPVGILLLAGLTHDFGYRYDCLINTNFEKYEYHGQEDMDKRFLEVAEAANSMEIVDSIAWLCLRMGGRFAWKENRTRNLDLNLLIGDRAPLGTVHA